jgi:uncharacterized protein with HEPN domain
MSVRKHSLELNDFLNHILEAINRIDGYTTHLTTMSSLKVRVTRMQ